MRSPAPPGKDREPGAMKVFACSALDGCVWMLSMIATFVYACEDGCDEGEQV